MSVTVSAVPVLLIYSVIGVSKGIINFVQMSNEMNKMIKSNTNMNKVHFEEKEIEKIFNKTFQTVIMDKDVLLKTLEEHGAKNIITGKDDISCDCENFHLDFTKTENKPYDLRISYKNDYKLDELVENLGNEYTSNAQEVSYNKIKERLEKQNLEIENEEIYDDNTIVLTVNLE